MEETAIVGVIACVKGRDAVLELFTGATASAGLSYVVIQPPSSDEEGGLPDLLTERTDVPVQVIQSGETAVPGRIYLAPHGYGPKIEGGILNLEPLAGQPDQPRPVDDFLASLARDRGAAAAAVILSGPDDDGHAGLTALRAAGGICAVQDPGAAATPGMPRAAMASGQVDAMLPPRDIPAWLAHRLGAAAAGGGAEAETTLRKRVREEVVSEIGHRAKNLFAMITALIRIASRSAPTPRALEMVTNGRIAALALAHDLGLAAGQDAVPLESALRQMLAPLRELDIRMTPGPAAGVPPHVLPALALVLHEWGEAAEQAGATEVTLDWQLDGEGRVRMRWTDRGSDPEGADPSSAQLVQMCAMELDGTAGADRTGDTTVRHLDFPAAR